MWVAGFAVGVAAGTPVGAIAGCSALSRCVLTSLDRAVPDRQEQPVTGEAMRW